MGRWEPEPPGCATVSFGLELPWSLLTPDPCPFLSIRYEDRLALSQDESTSEVDSMTQSSLQLVKIGTACVGRVSCRKSFKYCKMSLLAECLEVEQLIVPC